MRVCVCVCGTCHGQIGDDYLTGSVANITGIKAIHNIDLPFIRFECACVREKQHTAMIHCGKIMLCYANNW